MSLLLLLLGTTATHAAALDPLRVRVSAPVWQWERQTFAYDGDDLERKGSQVGLFRAIYRTEATWRLSEVWEAGAVLGYASAGGTVDGEEDPRDARFELLLTGAWNRPLSDRFVFFVQPLFGVDSLTIDRGTDWEGRQRSFLYGADVGVRTSLGGRLHLDGALEGLLGTGSATEGEEKVDLSRALVGLRVGLGIDF